MRAILLAIGYHTGSTGQYDGLWEYCGLGTASEVFFLIFTTHLYGTGS